LSPSHRSAVCTIATSVAQPELFAVTEPATLSQCRASSRSTIASLGCRRAQNTCGESASQESIALFDNRTSSVAVFFAKPIPRLDGCIYSMLRPPAGSLCRPLQTGGPRPRVLCPPGAGATEHRHTFK
jgi:hypothetical protein